MGSRKCIASGCGQKKNFFSGGKALAVLKMMAGMMAFPVSKESLNAPSWKAFRG
jgi:hypothetical protein